MSVEQNHSKTQIYCVGLSCIDIMLLGVTRSLRNGDDMVRFEGGIRQAAGGGVVHTLRALCHDFQSNHDQHDWSLNVHPITMIGQDALGDFYTDEVVKALGRDGMKTLPGVMKCSQAGTAVSVVPVYQTGGRGCYVGLGSNAFFDRHAVMEGIRLIGDGWHNARRVLFHYVYPYLTPRIQGNELRCLLNDVRKEAFAGTRVVFSMDLNGASLSIANEVGDPREGAGAVVPLSVLQTLHIVHANYEEACVVFDECPKHDRETSRRLRDELIVDEEWMVEQRKQHAMKLLDRFRVVMTSSEVDCSLEQNDEVLVMAVTLGRQGSFLMAGTRWSLRLTTCCTDRWVPAPMIPKSVEVNETGAGDAYTAGMIHEYVRRVLECDLDRDFVGDVMQCSGVFARAANESVFAKLTSM